MDTSTAPGTQPDHAATTTATHTGTHTATARDRRAPGSAAERLGWVLVALMSLVLLLGGVEMFTGGPDVVVSDSACCSARTFATVPHWTYAYAVETGKYTATYMMSSAVLALAVIVTALRRRRRWAWAVLWLLPAVFVEHAVQLQPGPFPFDAVVATVGVVGLLLMIRPVFGRRR